VWGGIGGYVTFALLVTAAFGLIAKRGALAWMLATWFALCLGKSFALEPATSLLNLVPAVPLAAFYRYAPPSWELAIVILAAFGVDALARSRPEARAAWFGALAAFVGGLVALVLLREILWPEVRGHPGTRFWARNSAVWAAASASIVLLLLRLRMERLAAPILAGFLAFESIAMFLVPTLSNPRAGGPDSAAIDFLRRHLGLHRFYTLGPIQPNYGAYFGIASINHNYLPVARRWTEFVRSRLDAGADDVVFNGAYGRKQGAPTQAEELRRNLRTYEWVGVKYVVAYAGREPFPADAGAGAPKRVYADPSMAIYELPGPKPYFELLRGKCDLAVVGRARLSATCAAPATLLRRELYFPGWRAEVNGVAAAIAEHERLFQEIALPAGRSEVRFDYAPLHIGWAWFAAALALVTLVAGFVRRAGSTSRS
jgi:hypothetical protein